MHIPPALLRITKFCDLASVSFSISGVKFSTAPDGTPRAEATDSRRLIRVQWPNPEDDEVNAIVPAELMRRVADQKLRNPLMTLTQVDGTVSLAATSCGVTVESRAEALEGGFPKFDDVIPDFSGYSTLRVNARLFAEALSVAYRLIADFDGDPAPVTLRVSPDPKQPIAVSGENTNGLKFLALVMPMGTDD